MTIKKTKYDNSIGMLNPVIDPKTPIEKVREVIENEELEISSIIDKDDGRSELEKILEAYFVSLHTQAIYKMFRSELKL